MSEQTFMQVRPPKKPSLTLDANIVQDNVPIEIVPKLFIGSIHASCNEDSLMEKKITHILNSSRFPPMYPAKFSYLSVDLRDKDDSNILPCIPAANIFIEAGMDAGGILVHCFGGRSRSAAFISAYLMSSRRMSYDDVVFQLKCVRPVVSINRGFERQLRAYFASNFDVYLAQQLLLRSRMKEISLRRSIIGCIDPPFPNAGLKSDRVSGGVGHKRAWGDVKALVNMECDDEDEDSVQDVSPSNSHQIKLGGELSRHHLIYSNTAMSSSVTANSGVSRNTTRAPSYISGVNPKSPSCLLSRPGTSTIRIIPPLRGLERGFCCSSCNSLLFCLANVIRPGFTHADVHTTTNLADVKSSSGKSPSSSQDFLPLGDGDNFVSVGGVRMDVDVSCGNSNTVNTINSTSAEHRTAPLTVRGGRNTSFQFDEQMIAPTPSIRRGSKAFNFEEKIDAEAPFPRIPVNIGNGSPSSAGNSEGKFPGGLRSPSQPRFSVFDAQDVSSSSSFSATVQSGEDGVPKHIDNTLAQPDSTLDGRIHPAVTRPPSAEKLRWLARLHLLSDKSGLGSISDVKVAKMAADDEDALQTNFGHDTHVLIEYLGWMGDSMFSSEVNSGEISCYNCHSALGSWSWEPNKSYEGISPIISISKNSVHHAELAMDQTPIGTPREASSRLRSGSFGATHQIDFDQSAK